MTCFFFFPVQILPCEIFLIIIFNVSQKTVLHLNCLLDWLITYFYFIFCGFFSLRCLWGKFLINALWQEVTQFMKKFLPPDQRSNLRFNIPKDSSILTKLKEICLCFVYLSALSEKLSCFPRCITPITDEIQ